RLAPSTTWRTPEKCRNATCAGANPRARTPARPAPSPTSTPTGPVSIGCGNGRGSWTTSLPPATRTEGEQHGLATQTAARRSHRRDLHVRTAQHGVGEGVPRPARAGDEIPGRG